MRRRSTPSKPDMRYFIAILIFVIVATVSILGFRSDKFTQTPVWVFPDMDIQARYEPQGKNEFYANEMDDRPMVPGTVQRGYGWEKKEVFSDDYQWDVIDNPSMYSGKKENGDWYEGFPIDVTPALLKTGQEKYDIFCTVCHGEVGDGNGITKKYGMAATPTYHDDRLRSMAEGEIFNTITNGKNLMGAYGMKLDPEERWAVIAYVRALQLANNATIEDVPQQNRRELGL